MEEAREGWRVHYQAYDGRIYSPVLPALSYFDNHPNKLLSLDPSGVNHSLTDEGYGYWQTKQEAEKYRDFLLQQNARYTTPRGILRVDKVRGIAKESDSLRMEDLQIIS